MQNSVTIPMFWVAGLLSIGLTVSLYGYDHLDPSIMNESWLINNHTDHVIDMRYQSNEECIIIRHNDQTFKGCFSNPSNTQFSFTNSINHERIAKVVTQDLVRVYQKNQNNQLVLCYTLFRSSSTWDFQLSEITEM